MVGELDHAGVGEHVPCPSDASVEQMWQGRAQHNLSVLSKLKEDEHSRWIFEHSCREAEKGWNSTPTCASDSLLADVLLSPRFAFEQSRSDGSKKLRAIDNLTYARAGKDESVSGCTHTSDQLRHHALDQFCVALKQFVYVFGCLPCMFKADVDAAFRRVPVSPHQRKYFASAFKHNGLVRHDAQFEFQHSWLSCVGVSHCSFFCDVWSCRQRARMGKGWRSTVASR